MKIYLFILILLSSAFLITKCDDDFEYHDYEGNPDNINIESISYELTYNNYSVVKVVIKTYDEIENDISFIAYLKSSDEEKEYKLNCSSTFYDIIECFSEKNVEFNVEDDFYFYYNKTSKFTFDENDILEDDKKISLVFNPEINIEDKLYKDKRKIIAETHGRMVGGGYLYITKRSKEPLNKPKDGFNKYIELNNFIPKIGSYNGIPISTLLGYKEAIKRGYHIVEAILRFTKNNVPVVSHEEDLEKITRMKGKISDYTLSELLQFDFGEEIDVKYRDEKILTLHSLLELCKDFGVILDLDISHLDTKTYFGEDDLYANKIIKVVNHTKMFDSVIFSDGPDFQNVLKLKQLKNDIAVSITASNKESYDKLKDQLNGSRIIYNSNEISNENELNEDTIKYGATIGNKMKAGTVDDINYARKIQSWGINFISTKTLPTFLIENEKEDPIMVRCVPIDDDNSECDIEDDIILKDNEWYNIYYSENIYNVSQDINQDPIGEFQYSDTNILDELYYKINEFNYERGIINLNLSQQLKIGEEIYGIVGPEYDNAPECYQYPFVCHGNDGYTVNCRIEKEEEDKVEYNGKYCIYALEDYSLNEFETETRTEPEETYYEYIVEKKNSYLIICCIIIVLVICGFIIYYIKCRKPTEDYDRIRIADNNYMSDNYLYR